MPSDFDILIVGGGMVGTCAAALLANQPGLNQARIALVEPQEPSEPDEGVDLRVSAVSRASERILSAAQAWHLVPPKHLAAYQQMTVWDARDSHTSASALHFSAAETGEPNLGYIVENRRIQWALFQAARQKNVTVLRSPLQSLTFENGFARVGLGDGRTFQVRLVVGADGAQSRARELAGIETDGWQYEQSAVVTHVATERSHQRTAWQRFTPHGPVAFLPLADGRSSIVWTNPTAEAERLVALTEDRFAAELAAAADHALGAVTAVGPRVRFPLHLAHARRYARENFVLVGDAAHSVHPLAGQGVNLGFLDCAALAEVLSAAQREGAGTAECGDLRTLRRYERWRKSENALALGFIDGLNRLFSNENVALSGLRRAGFALVENIPMLKRFFILRALGLAGETPAMVRGRA